jgi:MFS transporter, DHA1 family, multidrug resistance protein
LLFFLAQAYARHPPLYALIGYIIINFFCSGILVRNFNAIAVQPLGHIAGVTASTIAFMQTLLSALIGGFIEFLYNGTVQPLVLGYIVCSAFSLLLVARFQKQTKKSKL